MGSTTIALIFLATGQTFDLPKGLQSALCFVESTHRAHVVNKDDGKSSSIGLCQIKLATARMMGYKGTAAQLKNPRINAYFSAKYLKWQIDRYDWDIDKAIAAYNAGKFIPGKTSFAANQKYLDSVLKAWDEGR